MLTKSNRVLALTVIACGSLLVAAQPASAFWGHHRRVTTAYALPTTPVAVGYAPVTVARPVWAAPVVAAPVVAAPVVATAPVTTFYAPTTTVAASPVTAFYAPAGVVGPPIGGPVPGTVIAPAMVAPVTSFYAPRSVIVRRPIIWAP